MNTPTNGAVRRWRSAVGYLILATAFFAAPAFGADEASPPPKSSDTAASGGAPSAAEMQQMMELAKLNENHKLLAELAGTWDYTVKMWMAPGAPPTESKGTAVRKALMDGRYFNLEVAGVFEMPGTDGKTMKMDFKGASWEGYDNAKKKFVSTWIDNMGTGIMYAEGTYDPATKTFTYTSELEMMPGMKTKVRETVKVIDQDHHLLEWYEDRGGKDVKTMEIAYTRKK